MLCLNKNPRVIKTYIATVLIFVLLLEALSGLGRFLTILKTKVIIYS